jgi:hypothetical protein
VDDRLQIAAMCLQGMLGNSDGRGYSFDENLRAMPESALLYADRLIALHKVPAPSGGPVASPPGSDSPIGGAGFTEGAAPSTREGNQSLGSPAGVRASALAVRAESELPRSGAGRFPAAPIGQRNKASAHAYPTNGRVNPASPVSGAASLHAGEDAAAQGAPPGDLALPPSATAGENPARPVSRKAKPGTPCGGPSCRDSINMWIHDPRTCPLYKSNASKGAARGCSEEKR